MPPGAVAVAAVIPALITLMPTATVARIITFAVVGIYISFQLVVLATLIARQRGGGEEPQARVAAPRSRAP
jgi:hypothetical protein